MADSFNCDVCNALLSPEESKSYDFKGQKVNMCPECLNQFVRLRAHYSDAGEYFGSKLSEEKTTPLGTEFVDSMLSLYAPMIKQRNEAKGSGTNTESKQNSESFFDTWERESRFSTASGRDLPYVVLQVTLKEKFLGTGSGNLTDLEEVINAQVAKGYRLHTMSTSNGGSKGVVGGDRIQATLVFERLDMR